ncbi:hypothetical protein LZ32DRAFT_79604 [Colletotrichum eremochloae]|nr:hypothetical protein LZ32DRAFT_79604 [Colletotrichum eremochloae]
MLSLFLAAVTFGKLHLGRAAISASKKRRRKNQTGQRHLVPCHAIGRLCAPRQDAVSLLGRRFPSLNSTLL